MSKSIWVMYAKHKMEYNRKEFPEKHNSLTAKDKLYPKKMHFGTYTLNTL